MTPFTPKKEEKRKYFRIIYPEPSRPKIVIGEKHFDIIDISEQGVKFCLDENLKLPEDEDLQGIVTFPGGTKVEIQGKILRRHGDKLIILFEHGIPAERISKEHIQLRLKYPEYGSGNSLDE